jgi:hypothetical protein
MRARTGVICVVVGAAVSLLNLHAQQPAQPAARPAAPQPAALFFRETFKGTAPGPQVPMSGDQILSANLMITLYGPGGTAKPDHASGLQLANEIDPVTGMDVSYVWSGLTEANWAVTLKDKANYVDLTGTGRIRWRGRTRGFNTLRPVLKLADGTFLVGDYEQTESTYWHEAEFYPGDITRWRVFDQKEIVGNREGEWRTKIDLGKVDEIGFTDLSRGSGQGRGGNSGMDWIEVYGTPVKRGGS